MTRHSVITTLSLWSKSFTNCSLHLICFNQLDPAKTYIFLTLSRETFLCLAAFDFRITKIVLIRPAVGLIGLVQNLGRGTRRDCRQDVVWNYMIKKVNWIIR